MTQHDDDLRAAQEGWIATFKQMWRNIRAAITGEKHDGQA